MTWTVPAIIDRVIDGDTVIVTADLGWRVQIQTAVRIDGINAPELATAGGQLAKSFAEKILKPGDPVTINSKQLLGSFEKYGRVLADLTYGKGGLLSFAQTMLDAHQAKPWDGTGQKPQIK